MIKFLSLPIAVFVLLTLSGCIASYTQPTAGPTATITNASGPVTAFNLFQNAYQCTGEKTLTNNFWGGKGNDVVIPANQLVTLSGYTNNDNFSCKDFLFSFTPQAGHTYALNFYIGKPIACGLTIKDLTTGQNQPYTRRTFSRGIWSGKGMCTDSLAK